MIVLDTNVLSELTDLEPAPRVVSWLNQIPRTQLYVTAVNVAELLYGVARLPTGRRKTALADRVGLLLNNFFGSRALAFTGEAAIKYADILVSRERQGRPIGRADAQIAAICRQHGAELATRNVKDFVDTGVRIVDPWAG